MDLTKTFVEEVKKAGYSTGRTKRTDPGIGLFLGKVKSITEVAVFSLVSRVSLYSGRKLHAEQGGPIPRREGREPHPSRRRAFVNSNEQKPAVGSKEQSAGDDKTSRKPEVLYGCSEQAVACS